MKSPPSIKQDLLAGLRGGAFWFNQPVEVAPDYAFHGHHIIEIAGNAKWAVLAGNTISNSAILVQEDASSAAFSNSREVASVLSTDGFFTGVWCIVVFALPARMRVCIEALVKFCFPGKPWRFG